MAFNGKLRWFWGDTLQMRYPMGVFSATGATAPMPGQGLDPSKGVDLTYFVDKAGFSRAMAPLDVPGLIWLDSVAVVPDENGKPRMVAHYLRMKELGEQLGHGLLVWDERDNVFRERLRLDLKEKWRFLHGTPVRYRDGGVEYLLMPAPFATARVPAKLKSILDAASYESFTCLAPGTHYAKTLWALEPPTKGDLLLKQLPLGPLPQGVEVDRGPDGKLIYGWKRDTDPVNQYEEMELIATGKIKPEEARYRPCDVDTGKPVTFVHTSLAGSLTWNDYRKKWILIANEIFGSSPFGEIWFSECDSPLGPWLWSKKIVTHDNYTFYNVLHHPFFDQDGGRLIYFEGTYTNSFTTNHEATPRYNYNQIMYRLDLSDPRLPQPLVPPRRETLRDR